MTISMDEAGRQATHQMLFRLLTSRMALDGASVEQVVRGIEEDLVTLDVHDSTSPLFSRLVESHLRKHGLEDAAVGVEEALDSQLRLFGDAPDTLDAEPPAPAPAAAEDVDPQSRLFEPPALGEPKVPLTANALKVLEKRYLRKDEEGKPVETPFELFVRVAENIAKAEQVFDPEAPVRKVAREFLDAMLELRFLPNSPTLMNAGRELQQLSACFVLPIDDTMESIFGTIRDAALIQKSGGGTGFSFSRLRPRNDRVRTTKGVSSGPVSFMKAFDAATETIKQGGTRRGANMAMLRVDHPDVLDFISCKADQTVLNNFNISVAATEAFMQAVLADAEYDVVSPRNGEVVRRLSARKVFDAIVNLAWRNGEPGIVFIDRMNRDNPTPTLGEIEATNPCGEQPLLPYESCNLGSVNLARMVKVAKGKPSVDWKLLSSTVKTAVRFLDDVIEQNKFPLKEIEERTRSNRKIGLGVMGWADMLIQLGIPYDSDQALTLAEELMGRVNQDARAASVALAKERGTFPNFEVSTWNRDGHKPLRNATCTTIAPTGTISIIANCSSGVEPLFAVSYVRRVMDGEELVEVHPTFLKVAEERGFYSPELARKVAEAGTLTEVPGIPEDVQRVFRTSADVSPEWHVKMQAAFQRHVDNAVSKTVNFKNSATREDIREVYMKAYELGCKGVTVYRDGSRDGQVLSTGATPSAAPTAAVAEDVLPGAVSRKGVRPERLMGYTHKVRTSEGKFYLTVNELKGQPFEIFSTANSRSHEASVNAEALCRLVSLSLRHGIQPQFIYDQLEKVRNQSLLSLPYNIARVLVPYCGRDGAGAPSQPTEAVEAPETERRPEPAATSTPCPECGAVIEHEGGCMVCRGCGYSKCS